MNDKAQPKSKLRRFMFVSICVVFAGFLIVHVLSRPSYIHIDVPSLDPNEPIHWHDTHKTVTINEGDEFCRIFYLRRHGTAYERQGRNTKEELIRHFEKYIFRAGFTERYHMTDDQPEMPEGHFLPEGYLQYRRKDDPWCVNGSVSLAIWPIGGSVAGFHITFVTENPSYLESVGRSID